MLRMPRPRSRRSALFITLFMALSACAEDAHSPEGGEPAGDVSAEERLIDVVGPGGAQDMQEQERGLPCVSDSDCTSQEGGCQRVTCDLPSGLCLVSDLPDGHMCDDGRFCSEEDACLGGVCQGSARQCQDDNPCTEDLCDEGASGCVFTAIERSCDDGQLCTLDDRCVEGACLGSPNPTCACVPGESSCATYDDGDLCNGSLVCVDSLCVPDNAPIICPALPESGCELSVCEPLTGTCVSKPRPESALCDDGDACSVDDACKAGVCLGKALLCEDANPCTSDGCQSESGCFHLPASGECDDADLCTTGDTCVEGQCKGEDNPECACVSSADCALYEDGNLCNGVLSCIEGHCVVDAQSIVSCQAVEEGLAPCQEVSCVPTTGNCAVKPSLDGSPCNDANVCTSNDYCQAGQCVGLSVVCEDNNPCTAELCDPELGCLFEPQSAIPCDDKDACTTGDTCEEGLCQGDNDPSCQCFEDADCWEFEDGDLCNGTLRCEDNHCIVDPQSIVTCEEADQGACTVSVCVPETGGCLTSASPEGALCDDDNACTSADHCESGQCIGTLVSCDDGEVCTSDACDAQIGCTYTYNLGFCDDANPCTSLDSCVQGFCTGIQDEGCLCTSDADCDVFDDGDLCNGTLSCQGNKCVLDPDTLIVCPDLDSSGCTSALCDPSSGACTQGAAKDGKPCDDSDACTLDETCLGGLCQGGEPKDCTDGKPCTEDACDALTGCFNPSSPEGAACEDGDLCTEGDACTSGACLPGANVCEGALCQAQDTLNCGESDDWGTGFFDGSDIIDSYSCSNEAFMGNDYVYYFEAPYDGLFDLSLSEETGLTDLFILAQDGSGCDPQNCLTQGYAYAISEMKKGDGFYIVVDNRADTSAEYVITMECAADAESACGDGLDNDADGQLDCEDSDCASSPECAASMCTAALELECGESDSASTYASGSSNMLDTYEGCSNPFSYPGSEYIYAFTPQVSTGVTLSLSDESASTDVMVLSAACESSACVSFGYDEGAFQAEAGVPYFIVVDGFSGASGSFTLSLECDTTAEPSAPEICSGGEDEDGDGDVDCLDSDCLEESALCEPSCGPSGAGFSLFCPSDGDTWTNAGADSTELVDSYPGCLDTGLHTGPEYVYAFNAPSDGAITLTKSGDEGVLDMFVLSDTGQGCNPAACIEWGTESLTFLATQGQSYFVVVDGWQGAESEYLLSFSCGD